MFPHMRPVNSVGKASNETLKYLLLALVRFSVLENKNILEITAIGGSKSFVSFFLSLRKQKNKKQNPLTLLHLPSNFIFLAKTLSGKIKF